MNYFVSSGIIFVRDLGQIQFYKLMILLYYLSKIPRKRSPMKKFYMINFKKFLP